MSKVRQIVGVDVGGTFTDVFVLDEATGKVRIAKVPSTPTNQSNGFVAGITEGAGDLRQVDTIVHGTTVGTNALLERKGARTGLIATRGFRDVLEMRRRDRPTTWGLWGQFEPIVPRHLRLEVDERTLADGTIRTPVDLLQVDIAARKLLEEGCVSVCLFFINAFANPDNEQAARAAVKAIWPTGYVTAATDILPEIREFERCSTAALNAYLQPPVARYLECLETVLDEQGSPAELLIVQSNGGLMDVGMAKDLPVRTALSGPAAGVIAAQKIAKEAGFDNVITCDMGGTSFDVSLIAGGTSALAAQSNIDFGMVIRTPMIEITTIGAGGGSIARLDEGGLLDVGPQSAGSDPGPVAYGLGNKHPTVTDANIVLGRINPDRPIGGKLDRLDINAARAAIKKEIADPLRLDVMAAAEAIVRIANAKMAGAIRLVSIERGHDPKHFAAMPFGGGGALHTGALMRDIGLAAAIVPRYPGVTSALGCAVADMRHDTVQTVNAALENLDAATLGWDMQALGRQLAGKLQRTGASLETIDRRYELDMLYAGQTHSVTVPIDMGLCALTREAISDAFEKSYRAAYGRLLEGIPMRVMNMRVAVIGRRPDFDLALLAPTGERSTDSCVLGSRKIYVDGTWHHATVYQRLDLPIGAVLVGPAIAEQPDATILIEPGLHAQVDRFGNLIMEEHDPA